MSNNATILETALKLHHHGITIIPTKPDKTKAPAFPWKHYQNNPNTTAEIQGWYSNGNPNNYGLAIVTGHTSLNIEMAEIEGKAINRFPEISQLAHASGLTNLWTKLNTSWVEKSPTGGLHWIYRVEESVKLPGNTKLARHYTGGTPRWEVLTETRAEGGYFIAAPTDGTHHTSGKPWTTLTGGVEHLQTLTQDEREAFHALLASIGDAEPEPAAIQPDIFNTNSSDWTSGAKPGEHFELETSWAQILEPHGWTRAFQQGHTTYWIRPGKKPGQGFSATTGRDPERDRLYVFTTSTEFNPETPYTKFGAYALLEHGNNYQQAAKQLAAEGWGKEPTEHIDLTSILPTTRKEKTCTPTPENSPEQTASSSKPSHPKTTTSPASPETTANTPTSESSESTSATAPTPPESNTKDEPSGSNQTEAEAPTYSDYTNANKLIQDHGNNMRYNNTNKRWYTWDGTRWAMQPKNGGEARQYAIATALTLNIETNEDGKENKTQANWKKYSLSNSGITNTLALAETDPRISVTITDFDNNPYQLNTPAGIINLKKGELMPHNPAAMHTQITNAAPGETQTTRWQGFLTQILDTSTHDFIQKLIGAAAIGKNVTPYFPFLYGTGANGKSVFLETLKHIFGDYATSIDSAPLMKRSNKDSERFYIELMKRRFVVCSELNEDDEFNEARIKALTGGDTLTARALYSEATTFEPSHMIFAAGNHRPEVPSGGGYSFWRRFLMIDFDRTIAPENIDPELQTKLTSEHATEVMNWIIEGAVKFQAEGITVPDKVKAATKDYEEQADPLGVFLKERCKHDPDAEVSFSELYTAYTKWCAFAGKVKAITPHKFTPRMQAMGYETYRDGRKGRGFRGLKIRLQEASFFDSEAA